MRQNPYGFKTHHRNGVREGVRDHKKVALIFLKIAYVKVQIIGMNENAPILCALRPLRVYEPSEVS